MPRIDKTMLKGLDLSRFVTAERTVGIEVLEVTVLSDELIFDRFINSVYDAVATRWEMFHAGQTFPVTEAQFQQYAYTAVKARVARVRNDRFHVRCDDAWAVPAPLAAVLAGLGAVTLEAPIVEIIPKWDVRHDAKLLTYEEWNLVSRRLRAVEKDPNAKFVFAHAIEGGKAGDEALMAMLPVRDETGRLIQLEGPARMDLDPVAAMAYLILGLEPEGAQGLALPAHVLRLSPSFMPTVQLVHFVDKFAEAAVG